MVTQQMVLITIYRKNAMLLLGKKHPNLFGGNLWNGFGGKVESIDGSFVAAAQRELKEEIGCTFPEDNFKHVANLTFYGVKSDTKIEVVVFRIDVNNSNEVQPDISAWRNEYECLHWYWINEIPYDQMWPDDRYWLPLVSYGISDVVGTFHFENGVIRKSTVTTGETILRLPELVA